MLVPIADNVEIAYNNALRYVLSKRTYYPQTPRIMGAWWMQETGLKLRWNEMYQQLCIEFEDVRDYTFFMLRWL